MNSEIFQRSRLLLNVVRLLLLVSVSLLMVRIAWISDDALIGLRTALNLTHGWGPGFNYGEAVQSYTNPLWIMLWMAIGQMSDEWILGILIASVTCTALAVALIIWSTRKLIIATFGVLLLAGSNAFMEYSSSGLENPLAYLTLGLVFMFVSATWDRGPVSVVNSLLLGLLIAAILLTRMDLAILLAPVIVALLLKRHLGRSGWFAFVLGAGTPIVAWMLWSWSTYAAVLPNTFAAKRNIAIPLNELLNQGAFYVLFSSRWDLVTPAILVLAVVLAVVFGDLVSRCWTIGILLYLAYVIFNGGDFMSGRFLAVPVYVAVFVIVHTLSRANEHHVLVGRATSGREGVVILAGLIVFGGSALLVLERLPTSIVVPPSERWTYLDVDYSRGIADERGVWVGWAKRSVFDLWPAEGQLPPRGKSFVEADVKAPLSKISARAKDWPEKGRRTTEPIIVDAIGAVVGTFGIELGPTFFIVDNSGITDRFFAEEPFVASNYQWRIGHFMRSIPDGYLDAVRSGDADLVKDPDQRQRLKDLWSRIRDQS